MPYTVVAVPDSFAQLDTEMTTLAGDVPAWQNDGIAVSQADPDPVTGTISLSLATPTAAQLSALSRLGWLGRHLADDLLMDQSHQVDPTRSRDPAIGCLPVDLGQKILGEPGMPDDTALQLGAQSLGVGESRANGIADSVEPVEVEGKVLVQIQSIAIRSFVYGGRDLRQSIRERGTGYVLAVRSNYMITLPSGRHVTVKNAAGLVKPGMWQVLAAPGVTVINDGTDLLRVSGITAEQIGTAAWRAHLPVYELTPTHASLEEAFMHVTQDSIEYHAGATR